MNSHTNPNFPYINPTLPPPQSGGPLLPSAPPLYPDIIRTEHLNNTLMGPIIAPVNVAAANAAANTVAANAAANAAAINAAAINAAAVNANNEDQLDNLYECILRQIQYYLEEKALVIARWTKNDGLFETFVWDRNSLFLGKITILLSKNETNSIIPHTVDINITTDHHNKINKWDVRHYNNHFNYHITLNLERNDTLHFLCEDIHYIITPKYLAKRKMTFWNLLDGSYFVRNTRVLN